MKREELNIIHQSYDDLSVIFGKINSQYSGKFKRLIPNYTDDGLIYLLITTSSSSYDATILVCNTTDILASLSFTAKYFTAWRTDSIPMGAINKYIAITDNTTASTSSQKLRRFQYDPNSNTITELAMINSGNNYANSPSGCYTDSSNNSHFFNGQNRSRVAAADYNINTGSYSRNESGIDWGLIIIDNDFDGAGKKLFLKVQTTTAPAFRLTYVTLPYDKIVSNTSNYTTISNTNLTTNGWTSGRSAFDRVFACRRYNHWKESKIYSRYTNTVEILHNADYTNISLGSAFTTVATLNLQFPRLYVDENLSKYWTIDYTNTDYTIVFLSD